MSVIKGMDSLEVCCPETKSSEGNKTISHQSNHYNAKPFIELQSYPKRFNYCFEDESLQKEIHKIKEGKNKEIFQR